MIPGCERGEVRQVRVVDPFVRPIGDQRRHLHLVTQADLEALSMT